MCYKEQEMNMLEMLSLLFPTHFLHNLKMFMISASYLIPSVNKQTEVLPPKPKVKYNNYPIAYNLSLYLYMCICISVKSRDFWSKWSNFPASITSLWIFSESHGPRPGRLTKNNNDLVYDAILSNLACWWSHAVKPVRSLFWRLTPH